MKALPVVRDDTTAAVIASIETASQQQVLAVLEGFMGYEIDHSEESPTSLRIWLLGDFMAGYLDASDIRDAFGSVQP